MFELAYVGMLYFILRESRHYKVGEMDVPRLDGINCTLKPGPSSS